MDMITNELLSGVWISRESNKPQPCTRQLVLFSNGTGVYDYEHNVWGKVDELMWRVENNILKIEWLGKEWREKVITHLCGEVQYIKNTETQGGVFDSFIVDGYTFRRLSECDTEEKIASYALGMRMLYENDPKLLATKKLESTLDNNGIKFLGTVNGGGFDGIPCSCAVFEVDGVHIAVNNFSLNGKLLKNATMVRPCYPDPRCIDFKRIIGADSEDSD